MLREQRALVFLALILGCDSSPTPAQNELTTFRILALRADPPFIAPGASATIDALIYHPEGAAIDHRWSWCRQVGGDAVNYACTMAEEEVQARLDAEEPSGLTVSYDLGSSTSAQFEHLGEPDLLVPLCTTTTVATSTTFRGCDQFNVSTMLTASANGEERRGYRTLSLWLEEDNVGNANPLIDNLSIYPASETASAAVPLESCTLGLGTTYQLVADLPSQAVETYHEARGDRTEQLSLFWYVEGGTAAETTSTSTVDADLTAATFRENSWTLPEEHDDSSLEVIVVVRDGRGGVDWLRRTAQVGP